MFPFPPPPLTFNHLALGVSEPLLDEKLDDVRELAQKVSLLVVRVLVGGFDLVHRAHDDGQQQIQQNEKHDGHVRPEHQKKGELRGRVQLVQGLRQSQIAELPYHEKQERLWECHPPPQKAMFGRSRR